MITINNLSYGYSRNRLVIDSLTANFEAGHIYGLLGRNGVGKSTLLKLMCGLLHGKGTVCVGGLNPATRSEKVLRLLRFVPETESLPPLKVERFAMLQAPFYPDFDRELLHRALDALEVGAGERITSLSMGQRKKAVIAIALACRTPYLLMDEPTNGLDIPSKASFRSLLAKEMNEGRTVIISTHQVDDVANLIDAVAIMDGGRLLLNATTEMIGQRLSFGPAEGEVLYSEPTPMGAVGVMPAAPGTESTVNLKLLFGAAVNNPDKIKSLLQ